MKWRHSVVSNSLRPHGLQPTRLLSPWNFQARILEWVAIKEWFLNNQDAMCQEILYLTTFSKTGPDLCSYPIVFCNKFKQKAADSEVKTGSHRKNVNTSYLRNKNGLRSLNFKLYYTVTLYWTGDHFRFINSSLGKILLLSWRFYGETTLIWKGRVTTKGKYCSTVSLTTRLMGAGSRYSLWLPLGLGNREPVCRYEKLVPDIPFVGR